MPAGAFRPGPLASARGAGLSPFGNRLPRDKPASLTQSEVPGRRPCPDRPPTDALAAALRPASARRAEFVTVDTEFMRETDLLAGALRRAARRRGRCRGDRCRGGRAGPRPARRAAGRPQGREGVPRRPAGCGNLHASASAPRPGRSSTPRSPPWSPALATRPATTAWCAAWPGHPSTRPTASPTGRPARSPPRRSPMPPPTSRICAASTPRCWSG
jgi:hypothetical protein